MAMNSINPIQFKQLLQLKHLGIHESSINYNNITIQSDKFIVVKEASKISIIDIERRNINSLNISSVDSAIMNPSTSVLAIKNKNNFEIYNLSMKTKIKSICINDNILYWKWINSQTISYVTSKSVYHWCMEQNSKPIKQFDIIPEERKIQFIDYNASNDNDWLFLQAITNSTHNNSVEGVLQLYNASSKKYQPKMNAHGGCFAYLNINNINKTLFCFIRQQNDSCTKLCIVEIGNNDSNSTLKIQKDIRFEEQNDFIISMIPSNKFGCIYAISQKGYLYIFDLLTGKQIYYRKISNVSLFYAIACEKNGGIIICDRNGLLISIAINENNYIKYIINELHDKELAISIAIRYNLNGAEDLFELRFKELISKLEYEKAVQIAVYAPKQILRTPETIAILESVPSSTYPAPDLQFYTLLLKQNGSLNKIESIGLCQRILNAKPKEGIEKISKFLQEEKLYYCEELGDLLIKYDCKLAATIYYKSKIIFKTILCFIKLGNWDKIIQYCINENYTPDWKQLLKHFHEMNKENVVLFAIQLIDKKYIKPMDVINILLGYGVNDIESSTKFLLTYLNSKENEEKEDYDLQTKLFEINLKSNISLADALFDDKKFTYYDKNYIAQLCEDSKLYNRALQHYEELNDIKRVLQMGITANTLKMDFLIDYFGSLTPENALECLHDLLSYQSTKFHLQIVIEISVKYSNELSIEKIIHLFESNECFMGLYSYLSNIVNITKDENIVYKYIISCVKCKQFNELKNICSTNDYYNPKQIKNYLLENSNIISDPRPLIHVCDRFDFIYDLIQYLYTNEMYKFIEIYVTKMNESSTPKVIGCLLDLNCSEIQIKTLLLKVRPPQCCIEELVSEVEKRERLNLLLEWLEERLNEGINDKSLHNALGKIYISINNNPIYFLETNTFYDNKIIGKYCESINPKLSFISYSKALNGECDELLINISNKNGFYKDLSKYCLQKKDLNLWNMVLNQNEEKESKDNEKHKQLLIDQIFANAIPQCTNSEEISCVIKAFMQLDLSNELIQLLEKIIFNTNNGNYNFNNNENLQTLLMFTAIKVDSTRIMGYINNLNNYDGISIAKVCQQENYKLFEEAFLIYKKFKSNIEAMNVLLNNLNDFERANEFAIECNELVIWSMLGKSQLDYDMINECISCFIKANDAKYYNDIILKVNEYNESKLYKELIEYLLMCRNKNVRDQIIDSQLLYCYAKMNDLESFEIFIKNNNFNNNVSLNKIGDKLFDEELFKFSKIIFKEINNYSKLALCLIKLNEYKESVDVCIKANCISTWKNICFACIDAEKFKLAQMCGIHIIIYVDHLYDLIKYYEINGHFIELIQLLEHGINLERAHQGIYTQLGVLYAKYSQDKLMEHLKLFWNKLNISQLIQTCKDNKHWKELIFLYKQYNQFDNAADIMIQHNTQCWDHNDFKSILMNVNNSHIIYKSIQFYLSIHPLKLSELLIDINAKLDHKRVIDTIRISNKNNNENNLCLLKDYLLFTQQRHNICEINETLNNLFIEEDDYKSLDISIKQYSQFDQINLAQRLERNELLEFRRISSYLHQMNKRYKISIELSKKDKLWEDMIDTAKQSNDIELVEELLRYFVDNIFTEQCPKSCFAACLFTCCDLIKMDVVLELSWKHNLFEYSMPFMVQYIKTFNNKYNSLHQTVDELKNELLILKQQQSQANESNNFHNQPIMRMPMIDYMPQQQYGGLGMI